MSIKLISLTGRQCTAETEEDAAPFIELGYKRVTAEDKRRIADGRALGLIQPDDTAAPAADAG